MVQVSASITINTTPDQVWAVAGNAGGISSWLPALAESWTEGDDNTTRICVLPNGARLVEKIESRDDQARSYTYSIVDSPLPLASYRSTMSVTPSGSGAQVEWRAEVEPAEGDGTELQAMFQEIYESGLAALKDRLGG